MLPAAGTLAIVACAPTLKEFAARPRPACAGDSTLVSWRFSSGFLVRTSLIVEEPGASAIGVHASGSMKLAVPRTLTVSVRARRLFWSSAPNRLEVRALRSDSTALVPFRVRATDGDSLVTADTATWDSNYRIGTLMNVTGWPVRVTHAGVTAILPDSTPTDAFSDLPGSGVWETRLPRTMPGATRHPTAVLFRARFRCRLDEGTP